MTKKERDRIYYKKNKLRLKEKSRQRYWMKKLKKTENASSLLLLNKTTEKSEKSLKNSSKSHFSDFSIGRILQLPLKKKENTLDQHITEWNFEKLSSPESIKVMVSLFSKVLIVSVIVSFLTWCNYKFGQMDEVIAELPAWLAIAVFGVLEASLVVLSGIKFNKALKYALILAIMSYTTFGASQSFTSSSALHNSKYEGLKANQQIILKQVKEKELYIKENSALRSKRWEIARVKRELQPLYSKLENYNNQLSDLVSPKVTEQNVKTLFIFRLLLVLVCVVLSHKIPEDLKILQLKVSA